MKTYLSLFFYSEGASAPIVVEKLLKLGFKPIRGPHDFVYDWKREISIEEIFDMANNLHGRLKGLKVMYRVETV